MTRAKKKVFIENDHGWSHWQTPQWYIDRLKTFFGSIKLDPCAGAETTIAEVNLRGLVHPIDDGISVDWYVRTTLGKGLDVFVNPPYGRALPIWSDKIAREASKGCEIVALLPARTDTGWMHGLLGEAKALCFHRGRIRFENPPPDAKGQDAPKFPSVSIYFGGLARRKIFADAFKDIGYITVPS